MMPEGYEEYERPQPEEETEFVAPAPMVAKQWSWSSNTLLWAAGGVLVLGFGVWFLMSYTGARARWMAEVTNDNADNA